MKNYMVCLLILMCLAGCGYIPAQSDDDPPYVVLLTSLTIVNSNRCGGIVVDEFHILTAMHCFRIQTPARAVTRDLYEFAVEVEKFDVNTDLVLLRSRIPIKLSEYATFAKPSARDIAWLYGMCTYYPSFISRPFYFADTGQTQVIQNVARSVDVYYSLTSQACMNDSGSPVIQHGKVVGIVHGALYANYARGPISNVMYTIHTNSIQEFLYPTLEQN